MSFAAAQRVGILALLGSAVGAALWTMMAWLMPLQVANSSLWVAVGGSALCLGVFSGWRWRRIASAELAAVLLLGALLSGVWAWGGGGSNSAVAWLPVLLICPALYGLCAYFGASLGYLGSDMALNWRLLRWSMAIGQRFLLSKNSAVLSTVTAIAMLGVSLGVWLVLVSLGVLAGFEADLEQKIIGSQAHLLLSRADSQPFVWSAAAQQQLQQVLQTPAARLRAAAPFLQAEVAIASQDQYIGAMLFGIDLHEQTGSQPAGSAATVLTVLEPLLAGSLAPLRSDMLTVSPPALQQSVASIVLGKELARSLNVDVGDTIRLIAPSLEVLSPLGVMPKSRAWRVAGIFSSHMYEYDARFIYVALPAAQRFLETPAAAISGVQLQCTQSAATGAAVQALQPLLQTQPSLQLRDWRQRNQSLFAALQLERAVAFVVLTFIILVASFAIVNTLTLAVLEKRREIAMLKTMGAHDASILQIFLSQGLLIGGFGTLLGGLLGSASLQALQIWGFWIPGDVYYIDSLPVRFNLADVGLVSLAALLIVWDFAVFPALRGALRTPIEGLHLA